MNFSDFLLISPEIILVVTALFLLPLSMYLRADLITLLSSIAAGVGVVLVVRCYGNYNGSAFNGAFLLNDYTAFSRILVCAGGFCALLISIFNAESRFPEQPILILIAVAGMMLIVAANDILAFYMSLELQSISMYVLAASDRKSTKSAEAGIKYFMLGVFSSCLLLYGASLIYGYTGHTNFTDIGVFLRKNEILPVGIVIGFTLMLIAICFKLAVAPFHMWSPDVYEGAPTTVTAFFAIVSKVPLVLFMVRFIHLMHINFYGIDEILKVIGILSVFISAVGALQQLNLKRLLAYGSIGHIGYIVSALAVGDMSNIAASLQYLIIYVLTSLGIFAYIIANEKVYGNDINMLSGLYYRTPYIACCLVMIFLSMAGIPPFAGFFGKLSIISAMIHAKVVVLPTVLILSSVISCFYYLKLIKIMYFETSKDCASIKCGSICENVCGNSYLHLILFLTAVFALGFVAVYTQVDHSVSKLVASIFIR